MKGKLLFIIFLLLLPLISFSFPEIDGFGFYGAKVYSSNNRLLGYNINRYDDAHKKIREEYYDSMGQIIKFTTYEYDLNNRLHKEVFYDRNRYAVKEISYRYKDKHIASKVIKQGNKIFKVVYNYRYYKRINRVKAVEELFYDADLSGKVNNDAKFRRVKKTIYRYKRLAKRKDHYTKNYINDADNYKYNTGEIFRYRSNGSVDEVLRLDRNKKPRKLVKYFYDTTFNKIRKINVYHIKGDHIPNFRSSTLVAGRFLTLKNTFLYDYTTDSYGNIKKLVLPGDIEKKESKKVVVVSKKVEEDEDELDEEDKEDEEDEDELDEEDKEDEEDEDEEDKEDEDK